MDDRQLGDLATAAALLACSIKTIRRCIADGELTAYRVGKRMVRVDLTEVAKLARPI